MVGNFSNQRVDVQLEEQTVLVGLEPGAVSGRIAHGGVPLSVDFLASDGSGELAQVRSPSSTYSAVFLLQDPGGISATEFSDGAGTGDNRAGVAFLIAGGTIDPMDVFVDGVAVGQQLQFGQRSLWYPAEAGNVQVRARARNGQETEVPLRLQARELWYVVVHERDGALVLTPGLAGQQ